MSRDTDVAIVGGGCAGLSLAMRLAGADLRVTVVEPRAHYEEDRTWSFWRTAADPFVDCVRASWDRWAVSADGERVVRGSPVLRYQTLSARAVYDRALGRCHDAANVELRSATAVEGDPKPAGDDLAVATAAGELRAGVVVDTRPPAGPPGFGQYFVGHEVAVDGAAFDDRTVELMAFGEPRTDRIDFLYVLPFARDRALVEATSFAPAPPLRAALQAQLDDAVTACTDGRPVECVRREAGFIPMRAGDARRAATTGEPRWLRAGVAGGAARPSTGYAFQRIQRQSDLLAAALRARGAAPPAPPALDGPVTRGMDALFLKVLRRWPEAGPHLFRQLFAHAPADRLERFLSGSTASQDRLAVVGALPPTPFLRALLST